MGSTCEKQKHKKMQLDKNLAACDLNFDIERSPEDIIIMIAACDIEFKRGDWTNQAAAQMGMICGNFSKQPDEQF